MNIRSICIVFTSGTLMAALAGCGGGGDDTAASQLPGLPPASASESTAGFVTYASRVTGSTGDAAEVVDLNAFSPPSDSSDTAAVIATPIDDPSGPA